MNDSIYFFLASTMLCSAILAGGYFLGKIPFFIALLIVILYLYRKLANLFVASLMLTRPKYFLVFSIFWGLAVAFTIKNLFYYTSPNIYLKLLAYASGAYSAIINFQFIKSRGTENILSQLSYIIMSVVLGYT